MPKISIIDTDVLGFLIKSVKNLLELEHVIGTDDFFSIGGDSLAAIDLVALIKEQYQIKFDLIVLFEQRTLVNLANAIAKEVSKNFEMSN